jgi:prepilin-type N-terminal cleavage/methylation domain-containing protein
MEWQGLRMRSYYKNKKNLGFTLIELVIAIAILLIMVTALFVASINCILLNEMNNNAVTAANDAQYVLEQMKQLPYTQINNYSPPVFTNLHNETIPKPTVIDITGSIKQVTVNVNWTERQRNRSFSLSTRFARQG